MKDIPDPSGPVPSKFQMLTGMFEMQKKVSSFMMGAQHAKNSNDLNGAAENYKNQIAYGKQHLELALLHNEHFPPPVEIEPIVRIMTDALLLLADTVQAMNEVSEANQYRDQAAELSELYLSAGAKIDIQRSLAVSYTTQGRFNEALSLLAACREALISSGDAVSLMRVTIDLVDILNWLGDYRKSLDELDKASLLLNSFTGNKKPAQEDINEAFKKAAADIFSGQGSGAGVLKAVNLYRAFLEVSYYRALVYKALHKYDEAESLFRIVFPEYEKLGVGAAIEFHLIAVRIAKGECREALNDIEKLEPLFMNNENLRPKLASLLKLKAESLFYLSSCDKALEQLNVAIEDLQNNHFDPDQLWKLFELQGRILISKGKKNDGLTAFINAADIVNKLRKGPLGYRLDSTYLEDKIPLFTEAIQLASSVKNGSECCNLIEMIKSRTLTAIISIPEGKEKESQSGFNLKDKLNQLTNELDGLEFKAFRGEVLPEQAREGISSLRVQIDQVIQQIRFSDPRWRNLTKPVPFNISLINDILLRQNLKAISVFFSPDCITSVLLSGTECIAEEVYPDKEIRIKLDTYLKNLNSNSDVMDLSLFDLSGSLDINVSHFVAEKILDNAVSAEGFIIIPHGPLHLIPWSGMNFRGRRLFEYCPVSILPNLSCIPHMTEPLSTDPGIAIVGPPEYEAMPEFARLTGAEYECNEIHDIYSGSKAVNEILMGKSSTEEGFWDLVDQTSASAKILHIACHGISEPADPMHSGFILDNGRIDAAEIAFCRLPFDEVILSACSTGWRPTEVQDIKLTGDDILGLPGAFMESGARVVLVSIPPVNDEAGYAFMVNYHSYRKNGYKPMKAMQLTQKHMLENTEFMQYQWVGFTLYGCQ